MLLLVHKQMYIVSAVQINWLIDGDYKIDLYYNKNIQEMLT